MDTSSHFLPEDRVWKSVFVLRAGTRTVRGLQREARRGALGVGRGNVDREHLLRRLCAWGGERESGLSLPQEANATPLRALCLTRRSVGGQQRHPLYVTSEWSGVRSVRTLDYLMPNLSIKRLASRVGCGMRIVPL